MMSTNFKKKLVEISKVIEEKSDGISYILNEGDHYTIGTKNYSEKIAQYLNQTVEEWDGCAPNPDIKKNKRMKKQSKPKKVGYLWKIPVTKNKLLDSS
jgi:hypothetical protein